MISRVLTEGNGPVVLITGALAGIGRASVFAFADEGWRIVFSGRKEVEGKALELQLIQRGVQARFVRADVRNQADVQHLVEYTKEQFGQIDAAINNAGLDGKFGPISELSEETYHAVFDTNVYGTLLCMKHEFKVMKEQRFGSIVNISSSMGIKGAANASIYTGSKHAVEGITKSIALEAAPFGVRVNAVAPGPVQTDMLDRITSDDNGRKALIQGVPLKRLGTPEEIAQMIVFVASNRVPFMTGEIVRVNGGKTA